MIFIVNYYNMLRKQWQEYALKARQIAKRIVSGDEVNKDGVRLTVVTDKLDIYATEALNRKYSKSGSKASVHTYAGGIQEISTQHADGSEGLFKSNGECQSTNNPMDIEVKEYMNNSKNESKNMNKKLIKLTEADLHKIVKQSVNKILNESIANHDYIELNGNAMHIDPEYGELYATDMFLTGNDIRVNWNCVDGQHGGIEGNLMDEDIKTIWNILKSIKN